MKFFLNGAWHHETILFNLLQTTWDYCQWQCNILNFKVIALAARELNDAKEFAKKHDILKAYGSYEELTKDPELGIILW